MRRAIRAPRLQRLWLLFFLLTLVACNQADPPPVVETEEVAAGVASSTATATVPPTAPPPTVTPTKGPPSPTATLVLTATPTPLPTATPQIHVVEQFDTLLDLAVQYDVSAAEIAQANNISEDDFLQLGQEIIIPAGSTTEPEISASEAVEAGDNTVDADTTAAPATESEPVSNDVVAQPQAAPPPPAIPVDSGPPPPEISHAPNINPLTGLPVDDPAVLQRRPLMVRIGNDVGARAAQVGLNSADMVYEEITEWWVTRFTAIYLSQMPNTISPVRSARLINVQMVPQYQGALANSGGSDGVRWEISQAPLTNLDEYFHPTPYFYRPNEGWQTRLAIDAEAARNYMIAKGLDAPVAQKGFPFSDSPAGGEPAPDIYIPYPSATSFTEWHFDPASGKYLRWINGSPLVDAGDGQQISAANVIVYFAQHNSTDIVEDSNGATAIRMIVNGTGPAWLFRDGLLTQGTWQSDGTRTPFFRQADGSPYALKPGNTWVEVVPTYFTIGLNSADEASSR